MKRDTQAGLILLVEDNRSLSEVVGEYFESKGFGVDYAGDGVDGYRLATKNSYDVIVLDLNLPRMDGLQVCRKLREEGKIATPVLMLTARDAVSDKVLGLEAGADDYMVKPFRHPSELIARIRTRLRRTNADVSGLLTIGDLAIDVQAHQVTRAGKQIALTRLEFDLLVALAKEPGRVFTRDALLSEVWGYRHSTDTRLVNVHVQRLRSKIEHDAEHPEIVVTVRGVGYKAGVMGGS